jgi:serine/threonine protein kinase
MGNNIRGYQIQGDSPLGEGGFGKVYKASKDGKEYAIKKIIIDKYITE